MVILMTEELVTTGPSFFMKQIALRLFNVTSQLDMGVKTNVVAYVCDHMNCRCLVEQCNTFISVVRSQCK